MNNREFVAIGVKPGAALESQSGLQMNWPKVFGVLAGPTSGKVGAIVMHPSSNFMGHYLLDPLVQRGVSLLALNSRYAGNDSTLLMEQVIQDLGAGVRYMRERFDRVFLIGNSGGAALCAFYQAQAENLDFDTTPAGDHIDVDPSDLPPTDGIALLAAHPGRATLIRNWIDPSVISERDPTGSNAELDVFASQNGPPFSEEFLSQYRATQKTRIDEITQRVRRRLTEIRSLNNGPRDEAFIVYRTYADPRFVDLSLDPNDRQPGGNRGDSARAVNYGTNNLARFTTLTSWLSQWSPNSRADGPASLARTSVPVLQLEYTADGSVFPCDIRAWRTAAGAREEYHAIKGANHYLKGQPELLEEVADRVVEWSRRSLI